MPIDLRRLCSPMIKNREPRPATARSYPPTRKKLLWHVTGVYKAVPEPRWVHKSDHSMISHFKISIATGTNKLGDQNQLWTALCTQKLMWQCHSSFQKPSCGHRVTSWYLETDFAASTINRRAFGAPMTGFSADFRLLETHVTRLSQKFTKQWNEAGIARHRSVWR